MAKVVRPVYYKWQLNPWTRSSGPVLRHMNKLSIAFNPFGAKTAAVTQLIQIASSRKQPREKKFELEVKHLGYGQPASISVEYRNGDQLTLDAERFTALELLELLRLKRSDMEQQMDWVDTNVSLTLEEEAATGGDADMKKKGADQGGKKPTGKGAADKGGKGKK